MSQPKRREFISKLGIGTLATPAFLSGCTNDHEEKVKVNINTNEKYRWKMTTTWPPNFPILGIGCQKFADLVKQMTGGRMEITVYGGGELMY